MAAPLAVLREAAAGTRRHRAGTVLVALVVATACAAVLLSSGRAVAVRDAVLTRLDEVALRTVVLRVTSPEWSLPPALVDTLDRVDVVEEVTGFGAPVDLVHADLPSGTPVAARTAYGRGFSSERDLAVAGPQAVVSAQAAADLGLGGRAAGALRDPDGAVVPVTGALEVPEHLAAFEPLVLLTGTAADPGPITVVVAQVAHVEDVLVLETLARDLAAPPGPDLLTIETAAALAQVRMAVSGDLLRAERATLVLSVAGASVAVAAILLVLVVLQRKDFGRRRALGATRALVAGLVLAQTALVATVACAVAGAGTWVWLHLTAPSGAPRPALVVAVGTLVVLVACAAAVGPAVLAARRDPVRELRVP
ncbi:FtsX-like permease family protein [Cellulomonas triticagri]|uniref:FtsX-like permease family protein n=1 Tax=Cellulomonas triticagri TaxID=2483352 RepID=UPI0011C3A05C|nr:FtsX-like permease family protein [Cellulomonas triticagri]